MVAPLLMERMRGLRVHRVRNQTHSKADMHFILSFGLKEFFRIMAREGRYETCFCMVQWKPGFNRDWKDSIVKSQLQKYI